MALGDDNKTQAELNTWAESMNILEYRAFWLSIKIRISEHTLTVLRLYNTC
jgi:hypothetical protein